MQRVNFYRVSKYNFVKFWSIKCKFKYCLEMLIENDTMFSSFF